MEEQRFMIKPRWTLERKKAMLGVLFVAPWFFGFVFLFAVPLIQSLRYSFSELSVAMDGFHTQWKGFGLYPKLFLEHPTFNRTLVESVVHMFVNVPMIILFSLFAAVLLNQKFRGRALARAIFFLPVIMAATVLELETSVDITSLGAASDGMLLKSTELKRMLLSAGMGETIVTYITGSVNRIYEIISASGVQILIFLAGLQSVPRSLYEAAKIEGASSYESFWKITFPMISPLILTNIVYTVIDAFNNTKLNTLVMETAFRTLDFSLSAAMSWIYFVVTSIVLAAVVAVVSRKVFYQD